MKKIRLKEILPIAILLVLIGVVVAVIIMRSGGREPKKKEQTLYGFYDARSGEFMQYFNTDCVVMDYSGMPDERFLSVCGEIESSLEYYHKLFDIYHEYDGVVNLATINRQAGGEALEVSSELYDFLEYAVSLYDLTGGEMNIAMGSVLSIWHSFREMFDVPNINPSDISVPSADELAEASRHTDISVIELDPLKKTVRLNDPKAKIDAGALGKGYAAEMIAGKLTSDGVDDFILNFGGNLKLIGDKGGESWRIGIQNPEPYSDGYISYIHEKNTSVVTSGDYERFKIKDGVRYHHIIDKDTLVPAAYFHSVTVVTESSAMADALSTALFCMSLDEGRQLCESIREGGVKIRVLYVDYDGNVIEI